MSGVFPHHFRSKSDSGGPVPGAEASLRPRAGTIPTQFDPPGSRSDNRRVLAVSRCKGSRRRHRSVLARSGLGNLRLRAGSWAAEEPNEQHRLQGPWTRHRRRRHCEKARARWGAGARHGVSHWRCVIPTIYCPCLNAGVGCMGESRQAGHSVRRHWLERHRECNQRQ